MKGLYRTLAVVTLLGYSTTALSAQPVIPPASLDDGHMFSSDGSNIDKISDDGFTFVGTRHDENDDFQIFRWSVTDGFEDLEFIPNAVGGSVELANSDFSVLAGYAFDGTDSHKYVWTKELGSVRIDPIANGGLNNLSLSAISNDGSTIVGQDGVNSDYEAFYWTRAGGTVGLGQLAGGSMSNALLVSSNGSVIVGQGYDSASNYQGWRWTQGTGMVPLGLLSGGISLTPTLMTSDGNIITGYGDDASFNNRTFRWTLTGGFSDLGSVSGYDNNTPSYMTADGNIIFGDLTASLSGDSQAYRWTQTTGMVGLGLLTDGSGLQNYSHATLFSSDGSVAAGIAGRRNGGSLDTDTEQAFRWAQGSGMIGLGRLAGDTYSNVSMMTGSGDVIVGTSGDSIGNTSQAYRWDQANGMVGLGLLNVTLNGSESHANYVSADGTILAGTAIDPTDSINYYTIWTQADGYTKIGLTVGGNQDITGMSADGSALVGYHDVAGGTTQAFRWTQANGFEDLGVLPGGNFTLSFGSREISGDGSVIVGAGDVPGHLNEAFRWTESGGLEELGYMLGGDSSNAIAVSRDGNVIIGAANDAAGHALGFYWNETDGMQSLGQLSAMHPYTNPEFVNNDGSVIIGQSNDDDNNGEAFRWTLSDGMVGLGYLSTSSSTVSSDVTGLTPDGQYVIGQSYNSSNVQAAFRWDETNGMIALGALYSGGTSDPKFISDDGSVIAGDAENAQSHTEAFRWTDNDGMLGLGIFAGGTHSNVTGMSSDGSVIIGNSGSQNGDQAFRWTEQGGMVGLGYLSTSYQSQFTSAQSMNSDGTYISGYADNGTNHTSAFLWTQATGMKTVESLLHDEGVDTSDWHLYDAFSVSEDGKLLLGNGNEASEGDTYYIANLGTAGIISAPDLSESLGSVARTTQQATGSTIGNISISMYSAHGLKNNSTPLVYGSLGSLNTSGGTNEDDILQNPVSNLSFFMSGSIGLGQDNDYDNRSLNGIVGVSAQFTQDIDVGFGIIGSGSDVDLAFNGDSDLTSKGFALLSSYEPTSGFRWYNTLFVADMNVDIRRGYLNGLNPDSSRGKTGGTAVGAATQIGWSFDVSPRSTIMPYMELDVSQSKLHSYNESGGAFPSSFTGQEVDSVISRIGVENIFKLQQNLDINTRIAWGHRYDDGKSGLIASTSGLTQTIGADAGDKNWIDGAVGADWQATDKTRFNSELSGRTGDTAEPAVNLTVGSSYKF